MNMRFFHQAVALLASLILLVMLTLAATGKVSWLWFWLAAALCLGLSHMLRRKPKKR